MSYRNALVTGATSGIGREFAEQLAATGHGVVLVARDKARLEGVAEELGQRYGVHTEVLAADLSVREDVDRVAARLSDEARPIDLLVNNAGFGLKRPFLENRLDDEQAMLDVLVTAVMRLTHAALSVMVERGHGAVINVSSMARFLPRGTYSAAKAYVSSFSEWADLTYRDRGVRVMALHPGFTKTEFHARMDVSRESAPRWLWLNANRVVQDSLRDLERGRTVSIPGKRYQAIATVTRLTPRSLQSRFQSWGRR
jgi:short-subunit dehydrogenase